MKIAELRAEAKRLEVEARTKLDASGVEKDAAKASALEVEFDALMNKRDALVAQADRLERSDEALARSEEVEERAARSAREGRRPGAAPGEFSPQADVSDEYREHFRDMLASGGDLSDLSPEARASLRASHAKVEGRAQTAGSGPGGGYTVPTTLAAAINVAMKAYGPMYDDDVATVLTTPNGAPITMPTIDDTDEEAVARAEGADGLLDDGSGDVVVGKEELVAYTRVTNWIKWSFELSQDSGFSWEAILAGLIAKRAGRKANAELTNGTGAGQPLGFMTVSPLGKLTASNVAITFDDVIDLYHSVDPAYRMGPKVRFQMHDQSVKLVRKLKNGNGDYIWSDGDVTRGVPPSLLGSPVSYNQAMDQFGAGAKPMAFGDFGEFYVRKVGQPLIGVAREKFFPDMGIAGVLRYDGGVGQASAIKHLATPA